MNNRELFLRHVGQTSENPLAINIVKAEGSKMWDQDGKEYIDLIGGISVCNVGHRHPRVLEAINDQLNRYLHIMIYGELVENPQVAYAQQLTNHLPNQLNSVFYTASGSEATEGAMKLAKRYTGRPHIISFKNSYHGSTQGSLSAMGNEYWKQAFRPLLPGISHFDYNGWEVLDAIDENTACVIMETIQAEAGVIKPQPEWIKAVRDKCTASGTLLVLDEIQCGFGRNGTLWAFEQFDVVPDILLLGKALGGGMPLGAFVSNREILKSLTYGPELGHINTFGGHPICCAAGLAAMNALLDEGMISGVTGKSELFVHHLQHPKIEWIHDAGLMLALKFPDFHFNKKLIDALIDRSVFTDWFLFASDCLRIVPPLNIPDELIVKACHTICQTLDEM